MFVLLRQVIQKTQILLPQPQGFRYWQDPGLFNQYRHDGALGRFEGYVQAVIGCRRQSSTHPDSADMGTLAAFIIAGPEYISMVAGEAIDPRRNMP